MYSSSTSSAYAGRLGGFNTMMLNNLSSTQSQLSRTLNAIGTGYRVNRASDAPADSTEITRIDAQLSGLATAIDNNQRSFAKLAGVDGVQKSIIATLLEVRDNAQKMIGENNPLLKQVLFETIAAQLGAIDTLASTAKINGKKILTGDGGFNLGNNATVALDTKNSLVRTAREGAMLSLSFSNSEAARQAVIGGLFTRPVAPGTSTFRITTDIGSKAIQLAGGVSEGEMIAQINQQVKDLGARAEIKNGDLYFTTTGYGNNYTLRYEDLGNGVLNGVTTQDARGMSGNVRINAENYAVTGEYNNNSVETANVRSLANTGAIGATNLTFTTENGTATFAMGAQANITAAAAAINGDANVQTLGVRAEVIVDGTNNYLEISTTETGVNAYLNFNDSAGQLFDDGRRTSVVSGYNYRPGNGLQVTYSKPEISANLTFAYDKVAANVIGGVTVPSDFSTTLKPTGGIRFQIGDNLDYYDHIKYGFRNLTSEGLGLDNILKSGSTLYALNNPTAALSAIDYALAQVQSDYGGLGAFMNGYLSSTNDALMALQSSVADEREIIADTDMAAAALDVVRLQILQQAGISSLNAGSHYAQALTKLLPSA